MAYVTAAIDLLGGARAYYLEESKCVHLASATCLGQQFPRLPGKVTHTTQRLWKVKRNPNQPAAAFITFVYTCGHHLSSPAACQKYWNTIEKASVHACSHPPSGDLFLYIAILYWCHLCFPTFLNLFPIINIKNSKSSSQVPETRDGGPKNKHIRDFSCHWWRNRPFKSWYPRMLIWGTEYLGKRDFSFLIFGRIWRATHSHTVNRIIDDRDVNITWYRSHLDKFPRWIFLLTIYGYSKDFKVDQKRRVRIRCSALPNIPTSLDLN